VRDGDSPRVISIESEARGGESSSGQCGPFGDGEKLAAQHQPEETRDVSVKVIPPMEAFRQTRHGHPEAFISASIRVAQCDLRRQAQKSPLSIRATPDCVFDGEFFIAVEDALPGREPGRLLDELSDLHRRDLVRRRE
jgi:hypothetical protein